LPKLNPIRQEFAEMPIANRASESVAKVDAPVYKIS